MNGKSKPHKPAATPRPTIASRAGTAAAIASAAVVSAAAPVAAQPQHARLTVSSETETVRPGGVVNLGLTLTMDEHWHVYWPGYNDTGFPVQWELKGPGEALNPVWPAPKRYISPGGILDHVFEERVTIVVPVRVPDTARPGELLSWNVEAQWLVCKEACIPGDGEGSVTVEVAAAEPAKNGSAGELFAEARERTPTDFAKAAAERPLRWSFKEDTFSASAPNATAIAFYPLETSRPPANLLAQGAAEGGTITIDFEPGDKPVAGVLEITEKDGSATLVSITAPAGAQAGSSSGS